MVSPTIAAAAVRVLLRLHCRTALALPPSGALVTHKLVNAYTGVVLDQQLTVEGIGVC